VWGRIVNLRPAVLRALATLSLNDDRVFWSKMPEKTPEFAGMAFQVLTRIAPDDALKLLSRLPDNDTAIGSVARKLPDFVSQFQPERKAAILTDIAAAIGKLSETSAAALGLALKNAGCKISLPPIQSRGVTDFNRHVANFVKNVRRENLSPFAHA
jgi:hypothetical protein